MNPILEANSRQLRNCERQHSKSGGGIGNAIAALRNELPDFSVRADGLGESGDGKGAG
jgi:hypothetical protein